MVAASRDAPGRGPEEPARAPGSLVGRSRELDEIAGALADALAGRGQLLLLVGEPGIGKTRLADEATRLATARSSVPVFWGRAWEAGGAPAYWPWLDVLGNLVDRLDDEALRDSLGEGAALVAGLVPRLAGPAGRDAGPGGRRRPARRRPASGCGARWARWFAGRPPRPA